MVNETDVKGATGQYLRALGKSGDGQRGPKRFSSQEEENGVGLQPCRSEVVEIGGRCDRCDRATSTK